MGLLSLSHLLFKQKRSRRRRSQARSEMPLCPAPLPYDGSITLGPQKNSLWQEGVHSQSGERSICSGLNLPEDIWFHIHSLMPLKDAARSACTCHTFLHFWRSHPYLNFNRETLCLKKNASGKGYRSRCFTMRVDQILENHSGIGVKALNLAIPDYCKVRICHLNRWLHIAITPGIEEVRLSLPSNYKNKYSFPCSLLLGSCGNSILHLHLSKCAFRPPIGFNCLRSLTQLYLYGVCIAGHELGSLISNCFALEQLQLQSCGELTILEIPFSLERLSLLRVSECRMLQVIEIKAPNLSTFRFYGDPVHLLLGESSQVKNLDIELAHNPFSLSYAITKLPSAMPNLETLEVTSVGERINTPMVADKFLNLKGLEIYLAGDYGAFSPSYDYLSLVSFLDASPTLETFILTVNQEDMMHDSVLGDASNMRQIPRHKHDRLREVQIIGFCSAKSMVELTCHILENATSLESLTMDTIFDQYTETVGDISRCSVRKNGECSPIPRDMILEAHKALRAIDMYIVDRVPPVVKLHVGEPCSRCHAV